MLLFVLIILIPALVFLTCKDNKNKAKPSNNIQSQHPTKNYTNLHPLVPPVKLQQDDSKIRRINAGSLVKDKHDKDYRTLNDIEKLPEIDKKINFYEPICDIDEDKISKSSSGAKINHNGALNSSDKNAILPQHEIHTIEDCRRKPKKTKKTRPGQDINEIGQNENDKKITEPILKTNAESELNAQERYERKASRIRQGMRANPRDPQYDTIKGERNMPELEHDSNIIITCVNR